MKKRTLEDLQKRALLYSTRGEFQKKDFNAYQLCVKRGVLDTICSHMPKRVNVSGENSPVCKWTNKDLSAIALRYLNRNMFKKNNPRAYDAACTRKILDGICSHMPLPSNRPLSDLHLQEIAKRFNSRGEFREKCGAAYIISCKRGKKFLDHICAHMVKPKISSAESAILKEIQERFPMAQKFLATKLNIADKPYIKKLEVDIFVPELKKGIEFDGRYHHSLKGLKRGHPTWPDEDVRNYHEIKDKAFLDLGIEILHIKEEDWRKNKQACIQKCFNFLGVQCP